MKVYELRPRGDKVKGDTEWRVMLVHRPTRTVMDMWFGDEDNARGFFEDLVAKSTPRDEITLSRREDIPLEVVEKRKGERE